MMSYRKKARACFSAMPCLGTMLTHPYGPSQVDALQNAGCPIVFLDCDRFEISDDTILAICKRSQESGMIVIARIRLERYPDQLARCAALGVWGYLLPATEQTDIIEAAAAFCVENDRVLMLQLAHTGIVRMADRLLKTNGVDAAFIGPMALSKNLGVSPDLAVREYREAVETIVRQANACGKAVGVHVGGSASNLKPYLAMGVKIGVWGDEETLLGAGASGMISGLRQAEHSYQNNCNGR